jgi:hypothetical protein
MRIKKLSVTRHPLVTLFRIMRHPPKPLNDNTLRGLSKKVTLGDAILHNLTKEKHALRGSIVKKRHQASPVTKRHPLHRSEVKR